MSHTRPPSGLFIPLLITYEALIVLGFALKPSQYRPLTVVPIALVIYYILSLSKSFSITAVPPLDFTFGVAIFAQAFIAFDGIVFTDVQNTLCRVGEKPGQITSAPLAKRLVWGFDLLLSPRGVGWTHELPGLTKSPGSVTSGRAAPVLLWLSALQTSGAVTVVVILMAVYAPDILLSYRDGATPLALNQSLYLKVMYSPSNFVVMFMIVNTAYCILSLMTVEAGISKPTKYHQPFYGPLSSTYTLQNFWGTFWQQASRRTLLTSTNFILQNIRVFPPHTSTRLPPLARLLQLHTVFFLSGLLHAGAEIIARGGGGSSALLFFVLQPWGIMIELAIKYLVAGSIKKTEGPKLVYRLVGYIWVMFWFLVLVPIQVGPVDKTVFYHGVSFWVSKLG